MKRLIKLPDTTLGSELKVGMVVQRYNNSPKRPIAAIYPCSMGENCLCVEYEDEGGVLHVDADLPVAPSCFAVVYQAVAECTQTMPEDE